MEQTIQKIKKIILDNYDLTDKIPELEEYLGIKHLDIVCTNIARMVSDVVIRDVCSRIITCLEKDPKYLSLELEQLKIKYANF